MGTRKPPINPFNQGSGEQLPFGRASAVCMPVQAQVNSAFSLQLLPMCQLGGLSTTTCRIVPLGDANGSSLLLFYPVKPFFRPSSGSLPWLFPINLDEATAARSRCLECRMWSPEPVVAAYGSLMMQTSAQILDSHWSLSEPCHVLSESKCNAMKTEC